MHAVPLRCTASDSLRKTSAKQERRFSLSACVCVCVSGHAVSVVQGLNVLVGVSVSPFICQTTVSVCTCRRTCLIDAQMRGQ